MLLVLLRIVLQNPLPKHIHIGIGVFIGHCNYECIVGTIILYCVPLNQVPNGIGHLWLIVNAIIYIYELYQTA